MNYETSKILGGVGAILLFIGIIPIVNYYGILELVGAVLVIAALYGLSGHYRDSGIIKNAVIGAAIFIVGIVISIIVALTVIWANIRDFIYQLYPGWDGNWSSLNGLTPDASLLENFDFTTLIPFIVGVLSILAIMWIISIIAAYFIRRSLKQVSARSGVGLFGTAGTLLLVGAFLIIIAGLGFILMWIAALLLAIAFFQLKQAEPTQPTYPPQPTPQPST